MPRKSAKKKRIAKRVKSKSAPKESPYKFNIYHLLYLLIILIIAISLLKGSFGEEDDDDDDCGCGDCGCDGCCGDEEDDDDDDWDQDEDPPYQVPDQPPPPQVQCVKDIHISGQKSGDEFSYSFGITPCDSITIDIYLEREDGTVDEPYIYRNKAVMPPANLHGSGTRLVSSNEDESPISKFCLNIQGGSPCCTSSGQTTC